MFESDDYDQVLSQLDFTNQIQNTAVADLVNSDTRSEPKNILGVVQAPTNVVSETDFKELETEKTDLKLQNSNCIKDKILSPKHTKRKIIDTHFDCKNKRKFPGPAGLLTGTFQETKDDNECQIELFSQDIDSSQNHAYRGIFETPLWKRLLEDTKHLNCNSIKMIKQQAMAGNLKRKKAEIVCGYVESIDRSAIDPLLTLRDTTGHIKCTLHRDAWNLFSSYIVAEYCALVLQKPTVLTTGSAFKKHYLNITMGNILHIFSSNVGDESEELPDGYIKIIESDFSIIKCDRQRIDFNISPNIDVTENILEDLEGAFTDVF